MKHFQQLGAVAIVAGLMWAPLAHSQEIYWIGGDGDFFASSHWDGGVPGAGAIAIIYDGSTATIAAGASEYELGSIRLGPTEGSEDSGHVIMNGGTLRIGGTEGDPKAVIGFSTVLSTFIMNGGTIFFDGPDLPELAGSTSGKGQNELDWEVGEKGLGRFEMHNDAVMRLADDLKIAENAAGQGTCLIDGNARLSAGSGLSISGNGGIEQSMTIAGNAVVDLGNSMGAGNPAGHTDEGYLTMAFGNSTALLTIQDNAVLNMRRLTAREGQSTIIVKNSGHLHIFDVLTGTGDSAANRPAETGPNSTYASASAADTNIVSTLTLQDDAVMTVNSDPASGPTKGLAISGQRDSGNAGGKAKLIVRDRASFRVEQDLMLGSGANSETSDGTLEVVGPAAQVWIGANLDMAVDLDGNVVGLDPDQNPMPGKATLSAVITGATHATVNVAGLARIANGRLSVTLDGYTPTGGETYTLIQGGTIEGQFAETNLTAAPLLSGLSWTVEYAADAVRLKVLGQAQRPAFDTSKLALVAGKLHLEWNGAGTLVGADTVNGTYTAVPGVSGNSADVPIDGTQRYFRILQ